MELLSRKEELILLMIWKLGDDAFGLTIRDALIDVTGVKWLFGSIYTPLTKLYEKGMITKYDGNSANERGGRPRVYFNLTPRGKEALTQIKHVNEAIWGDMPPINL